jgi:ATP-dependent DNA helicase RecQ
MDMRICITQQGAAAVPLTVEAFGLSLSLSGLGQGCPVAIAGGEGGLTISIGGAGQGVAANGGGQDAEMPPCEGAAAGMPGAAAHKPDTAAEGAAVPGSEDSLFKELSALRKKAAAEAGVPPYCVFHDSTLREMCRSLPADLPALGAVQGVGQAKLEKYGSLFIEAIAAHTGAA